MEEAVKGPDGIYRYADGTPRDTAQTFKPSPLAQFFEYAHLPEHLQAVSKPFGDLAHKLDVTLPGNPEKTVALRKLLEAKDCAVRAILFKG